jgi:hypothetical protein
VGTDPDSALTTGSPALPILMLSLGRLLVGRLVLAPMVRRGERPRSGTS